MVTLREYRPEDAAAIVSWAADERALRLWTADQFLQSPWPLTAEQFDGYYRKAGPACRPMTAVEEDGAPAGHLLLRRPEGEPGTVRLGFVIVDAARRGRGVGRRMVEAALDLALGPLGAERVTLGVFAENASARRCYEAAGFRPTGERRYALSGELWRCTEMECRPADRPDK